MVNEFTGYHLGLTASAQVVLLQMVGVARCSLSLEGRGSLDAGDLAQEFTLSRPKVA